MKLRMWAEALPRAQLWAERTSEADTSNAFACLLQEDNNAACVYRSNALHSEAAAAQPLSERFPFHMPQSSADHR